MRLKLRKTRTTAGSVLPEVNMGVVRKRNISLVTAIQNLSTATWNAVRDEDMLCAAQVDSSTTVERVGFAGEVHDRVRSRTTGKREMQPIYRVLVKYTGPDSYERRSHYMSVLRSDWETWS